MFYTFTQKRKKYRLKYRGTKSAACFWVSVLKSIHGSSFLDTIRNVYESLCNRTFNYHHDKTPAQAFTPPAEKKIGTKWAFMYNCSGRENEKWLFKNI